MKPLLVTTGEVIAFFSGVPNHAAQECIDSLEKTPNAWRLGGGIDALRNTAKHFRMSEGKLICDVLRAFYDGMNAGGVNYGMAHVCALHWRLNHIAAPMTVDQLAKEFSERQANEWHTVAMGMTSDAQVALVGWIESWNRKQTKLLNQHQKKIQHLH